MNKTELQNKVNELEAQLAEARKDLENWKPEGTVQTVAQGAPFWRIELESTGHYDIFKHYAILPRMLNPLTEDLTKKGARLKRDVLQLRLDIMLALDEHVPDWHVLDWHDDFQRKYRIFYNWEVNEVGSSYIATTQVQGTLHMTATAAEYVLQHFGDRIKNLYERGGAL